MKLSALLVSDYMTPSPIIVGPEDALMRAVEVMRLQHPPHPGGRGRALLGLVADGDLKRAQPSALTESQEDFDQVMEETPISRIMIPNP